MILMSLERTPASLRGELSRWLMEIRTGVYLGHVEVLARRRDRVTSREVERDRWLRRAHT